MSSFSLEIHSFTSVTGFSKNTASSSPPKILFFSSLLSFAYFCCHKPAGFPKPKPPKRVPKFPLANFGSTSLPFRGKKTIQEIPFPPRSLRSHEQSPGRLSCFFLFREILGVFSPLNALLAGESSKSFATWMLRRVGDCWECWDVFLPMIFKKTCRRYQHMICFWVFDDEKPWLMAQFHHISYPT